MNHLLAGFVSVSLLFVGATVYLAQDSNLQMSSAPTAAQQATATMASVGTKAQSTEIVEDLDDVIKKYSGLTISVSVTDIDNDYNYNAGATDTLFKGASTIKVLTATYFMHQVEAGETSLDTTIAGTKAQALLQAMLQDSSNSAWATITGYLGDSNIQAYADSIGLGSFTGDGYNTIKTTDYAKLLTKLHTANLITAEHRDILYEFMQGTDNETLIPVAVPDDMTVYHKWGTVWGNLHDAALISYGGHTYAVVIYTNSEDDTASMNSSQMAAIHDITATVTKYIQQNN